MEKAGRTGHRRHAAAVFVVALAALLGACGGAEQEEDASPIPEQSSEPVALNPLLDVYGPAFTAEAPDTYRARFVTNEGEFVIEVNKALAPLGANRFYNLVRNGFYNDVRFYRAIENFMVQFGLSGDPSVTNAWQAMTIPDDPRRASNERGTISFATAGPNTRTTQVFINLVNNPSLDASSFAPFGRVVEGMDVVDAINTGYGEGAPNGSGPSQAQIRAEGNMYLTRDFPELDYIQTATIEGEAPPA